MSWQPHQDPVPGDAPSCDALDLVIVPRSHDLGGFAVRRALPSAERRLVGPFVFFDQMGPAELVAGTGMDVRPHPHIGLATVTYLFDGRVMHRDSEGNALEIVPGEMNLMTAGRGIAHSERTPPAARAAGGRLFGIQSWIALPAAHEETAPGFQHYAAGDLPEVRDRGVRARVIGGRAFGARSPVGQLSDWVYAEVLLDAGAAVPFDPDQEERAVYLVEGRVEIAGDRFDAPALLVLRPGDAITVRAAGPARAMFLGGAAMDGPRHLWWNFVSSRRERIEAAKADWKAGRFAPVPGESEFIPLPEG